MSDETLFKYENYLADFHVSDKAGTVYIFFFMADNRVFNNKVKNFNCITYELRILGKIC